MLLCLILKIVGNIKNLITVRQTENRKKTARSKEIQRERSKKFDYICILHTENSNSEKDLKTQIEFKDGR